MSADTQVEEKSKGSRGRGHYRQHVKDLFEPNLGLYFTDLIISYSLFVAGFYIFHTRADGWAWGGFVLAVLAVYRSALFIHEIVHLPKKNFKYFSFVWNVLYGIPFMLPSFMYESHLKHHYPRVYGTAGDPEYVIFDGKGLGAQILFMLAHSILAPILVIFRFTIVTFLSLFSAKVRLIARKKMAALAINPAYENLGKKVEKDTYVNPYEIASFVFVTSMITLVVMGIVDIQYIYEFFAILASSLFINGIRTLAAHTYANHELQPLTEIEQLTDSLNHVGNPIIGELMAPVGLRFHALHHLFPTIPYHNLYEAHRRLIANLPADDPYHTVGFKRYLPALWAMK